MRPSLKLCALVVLILSSSLADAAAATKAVLSEPDWKAGVATVNITPSEQLRMSGYAARKKPAEGTLIDLYAKALALEDLRGRRVVVLTLDLIGVPRLLRESVARQALERFQLPPSALVMNASHTHCGPVVRTGDAKGRDTDPLYQKEVAYRVELERRLVTLIGDALDALAPARLSYTFARAGFAMNRRTPTDKGYRNFPNPEGPVDHQVPVLQVSNEAGELKGVLFGYACHNTTLGIYLYGGDYAGFAQKYFEAAHPGVTALFLMGCGADQNPYPRSLIELAEQHGRTLATAVEAALQTTPRPVRGPLLAVQEDVLLDRTGKLDDYPYTLQILRFGNDLVMPILSSEVVVDYSLRLKKEFAGSAAVWVAGYSNDYCGYIPSRRVELEGGYEANGPWELDTEERIMAKLHELNRRMTTDAAPTPVTVKP